MTEEIDKNKLNKVKNIFFEHLTHFEDAYCLNPHILEMERWAKMVHKNNLETNLDVILLSVYLHDIGHYPIHQEEDHAIAGERVAKEILKKEEFDEETIEKVAHCIRAHRCKDVLPQTKEAKIVAFIDSASHMTNDVYLHMIKGYLSYYKDDKERDNLKEVSDKIDRDLRDIRNFQKDINMEDCVQKLEDICNAWKIIITEYSKLKME